MSATKVIIIPQKKGAVKENLQNFKINDAFCYVIMSSQDTAKPVWERTMKWKELFFHNWNEKKNNSSNVFMVLVLKSVKMRDGDAYMAYSLYKKELGH